MSDDKLQVDWTIATKEQLEEHLTIAELKFVDRYLWDWNATKAYQAAHNKPLKAGSAATEGSKWLKKPHIKRFIQLTKDNVAESVGISKRMLIGELAKIARASFSGINDTWVTRNDFEELDNDIKDAIQEISTKTVRSFDPVTETPLQIEYVKIKFYSKTQAIKDILASMGWNEAEQIAVQMTEKRIGSVTVKRLEA